MGDRYVVHPTDPNLDHWERDNFKRHRPLQLTPNPEFLPTLIKIMRGPMPEPNISQGPEWFPYDPNSTEPNPVVEKDRSLRRQVLEHAIELIDGDRNASYGDPVGDFRRTASFWNTYLLGIAERRALDAGIEFGPEMVALLTDLYVPHDVAIMMDLIKTSRICWSPEKEDHWADKGGYTGCGWDCVVRE